MIRKQKVISNAKELEKQKLNKFLEVFKTNGRNFMACGYKRIFFKCDMTTEYFNNQTEPWKIDTGLDSMTGGGELKEIVGNETMTSAQPDARYS